MLAIIAALFALFASTPAFAECASGYTRVTVPLCQENSGLTTVDDTDSSVIYSLGNSNWNVGSASAAFGGSYHYSNVCSGPPQSGISIQGAMAAINFTGTKLTLIGETGNNFGIGAYAVDGGALTVVDAYDSSAGTLQRPLFTVSGLANTSHVLSYQVSCNKNSSSSDFYQAVDAYKTDGSANALSTATAGTALGGVVTYTGSWSSGSSSTNLSGGQVWDGTAGDTISWTFSGSLIEMFGRPDVGSGYFDVYIDGARVAQNVNGQYGINDDDLLTGYMLWASKVSPGTHTIKIVVDGTEAIPSESESSGLKNLVQFDEFLSFP